MADSRPLAELPKAPSLALPDPDPAELEALDALMARITDPEAVVRERAVRELLEVTPRWTAALHTRLDGLADRADKIAMKGTLEHLRSARRQEGQPSPPTSSAPGSTLLELAVERAAPESETWRRLVQALAMSRMLRHIGTTPAARSLVHVYVRYGEFLRVNTQLELEAMGDRSLAALIEARRHPAQKIAQWAERQLDLRGKAIVGEALGTEDSEALADILRAFGRIRDPDSARVIISFAQSERAQLRSAAREALVLLGEVATWQLRDAYENTLGQRAPREWTWQRTARELFSEFDRLRQAAEYEWFEQGLAAQKARRFEEMLKAYDRVLAENPMFERRDEMAQGYLDFARTSGGEHPDRAISALRRAERVSASEDERRALRSLRYTFEAQKLLGAGLADQGLLHQAMALDPQNRLAEETLSKALAEGNPLPSTTQRYGGAALIAVVSLAGAAIILWIGARRRRPNQPLEEEETDEVFEESDALASTDESEPTEETSLAPAGTPEPGLLASTDESKPTEENHPLAPNDDPEMDADPVEGVPSLPDATPVESSELEDDPETVSAKPGTESQDDERNDAMHDASGATEDSPEELTPKDQRPDRPTR